MLVTPPNHLWQRFLEDAIPTNGRSTNKQGKPSEEKLPEEQLSIKNTIIKFFLDQTFECWINTLASLCLMGLSTGRLWTDVMWTVRHDFWDMVFASYKLWPLICILNLVVVPFDYRMLVGNTAGLGWGIYVSLTAT